jgi:predicted dehydrogenase
MWLRPKNDGRMESDMEVIRFALVGAGTWGRAHASEYHGHPRSRLVAVCDSNLSAAEQIASAYGVEAFDSVEAMLEGAAFDAAGVATPDFAHRAATVALLDAGKHVLLEKPLATTMDDATAIVDAVRRSGARLMVDFHNRWSPPINVAKQTIAAGDIGTVSQAYIRLNNTLRVPTQVLSWSARSSILWFLGSHSVDTLRWLLDDDVVRVYSVARRGVLEALGIPVDDGYQTILEFAGGATAVMENHWIAPNTHPNNNDFKINVLGTEGMVDLDLTNHGAIKRFLPDRADHPDVFVKPTVGGRPVGFAHASIRAFVDCLSSGDPFPVSVEDAYRATAVLLAIMSSSETRTPVVVAY